MLNGTNIGNYLVEVDGVAVCQASEVEIGGAKHEPYKINLGDRPNPVLGRGKYECDEVKIKQAFALNNEGNDFTNLYQNYIRGLDLTKRTIRIVTLGEDGATEIATDEFIECVPTMFQPDGKKGEGKEAAYFTIAFKPTDWTPSY
jgi:hypothetical protein